jgi:hypothetical protein
VRGCGRSDLHAYCMHMQHPLAGFAGHWTDGRYWTVADDDMSLSWARSFTFLCFQFMTLDPISWGGGGLLQCPGSSIPDRVGASQCAC